MSGIMPKVKSKDDINIFYEVLGEGEITLIFIGGLGASTGREIWKHQLSLSSNYKLVLIDLAGHGRSDTYRENYTMQFFGQDINAVVENLQLKNIILIGQSMGGAAILEADKLISDRTIALIAIDSLKPNSTYTKMSENAIKESIKPFEENFEEAFGKMIKSMLSNKFDPKDIKFLEELAYRLDSRSIRSTMIELSKTTSQT